MNTQTDIRKAVTRAAEAITGRRWCSHHQGHAEIAGGIIKAGTRRWICVKCILPTEKK